jgi:hypothetical protein
MDGANGQTGGNNPSSTFVLTAFISFGLCNIFRKWACEPLTLQFSTLYL